MIGRAVTFNPSKIGALLIGMYDPQIHSEARDAHLGVHSPALFLKCSGHGLFERGLVPAQRAIGPSDDRFRTFFGILQERFEIMDPASGGPLRAELLGQERCVDDQLLPGSGDGYVEATLAPVAIDCAKIDREFPGSVESERDGEHHYVPLVSLYIF